MFRTIILVDGRSGSGKSELAAELAERLNAQLLQLDDVYQGWGGLDRASQSLGRTLRSGRWRSWNWDAQQPGPWRRLSPGGVLIVEGVGALTRETRALADVAVWLDVADRERERRAIARDGDAFRPYWRSWAAQEARLLSREHPKRLADAVLAGAPVSRHADQVQRVLCSLLRKDSSCSSPSR